MLPFSNKQSVDLHMTSMFICQNVCLVPSFFCIFCPGVRVRCLKGIIGYCVDDVSEQLDLWKPF
jgi:hypothetical protein